MGLFENKVITHYLADTSQERAAIDQLIAKNDQLKKAEANAAKDREQHFDQLVLDLTRAARAEDDLAQKQAAIAKESTGMMSKLSAIADGLKFDRVLAGVKELGKQIGGTTGQVIDAADAGAKLGAVFGPLGSAAGALGAVLGDLGARLYDNGRHELVIKSYEAMIDTSERLSAAYRQVSKELDGWTSSVELLRNAQEKANRTLLESATGSLAGAKAAADERVKTLQVAYLTEKRFVEQFGGSSDQLLLIAKQLRDARIEQSLAFKDYGPEVIKIREEEQHRLDTIAKLNRALADGALTQKQYQKLLADANKEENAAAKAAQEKADAIRAMQQAVAADADLRAPGQKQFRSVKSEIDFLDLSGTVGGRVNQARYDADLGNARANSAKVNEILRDPELQKMLGDLQEAPQRNYLETIFGPIEQIDLYQESIKALGGVFSAFTDAVGAGYEAIVTGAEPIGQAFKKAAAASLLATGKTSAIDALRETALGFGSLALGPIGGVSATAHFKAAALHAGVAVAAGVASYALGGGGSGGGSSGGGGSTPGRGGSNEIVNAGGTGTRAERSSNWMIVYADPFAEGTPGVRRRSAKKVLDRARGGNDWEDN